MTHYFDTAKQLTAAVRSAHPGLPVIWGGFHPSVRPDECIHHADYVAIGDAEDLILQLVEAMENGTTDELHHIRSLIWKKDGEDGEKVVVRNAVGSLEQDLDEYPAPDFARDDHWILSEVAQRLAPPLDLPDKDTCLRKALNSQYLNTSLEQIRTQNSVCSNRPKIAYTDLQFDHPDGKYRFPSDLHPEPPAPALAQAAQQMRRSHMPAS